MKRYLLNILPILFVFVLFSCDPTGQEQEADGEDKYLVSYTKERILSIFEIDVILGALKNKHPEVSTLDEATDLSVWIITMDYKTTFQGKDTIASGLVCVPIGIEGNEGPFPLLSFQNGTNVLHSNAPSVNPDYELYLFLEAISAAGFIVVAPDYLGFGASEEMFHPYLDKESTTQSVVDMLMATKELMAKRNLDVDISNDLYIAGYSQGGWATLHLQKELEENYSSDFNLKASGCGAGPYNLLFLNSNIMEKENYPMPYFLGYMMDSYSKLGYMSNSLDEIFNEPYASRVSEMYDGTHDSDYLNLQLTTSISELFTSTYRNEYASGSAFANLRASFLDNSVEAWNISTPLMLAHGEDDTFVPAQVSINMYNDFLDIGVDNSKINLKLVEGAGHQQGIVPTGIAFVNWFLSLK